LFNCKYFNLDNQYLTAFHPKNLDIILNKDIWLFLHESVSLSITIDRDAILGTGGYGTVFRGEWNNKIVAVKRIELVKCENKKEEEALQKLDHPNVVKLYRVESDRDFR
jgi:predicted Ser/Thr protein kinase